MKKHLQFKRGHIWVALILLVLAIVVSGIILAQKSSDPVIVAAGDIADCATKGSKETAQLIAKIDGTVLAVGDEAYPGGTMADFKNCYDPTWGIVKSRTRPVPGNHEYVSSSKADPYYTYFGDSAGQVGEGYYSYNLGAWHIIALNSNIDASSGSPQMQWLRADLAANPTECTLAYWHHPIFTSGHHEYDPKTMQDVWRVLYEFGVDVVINGHEHDYERFALQDPDGKADPAHGIREFVVGTGGAPLRPIATVLPNSEVRNDATYGVLTLTLHPGSYDWEFIPAAGKSFHDSGSSSCVH